MEEEGEEWGCLGRGRMCVYVGIRGEARKKKYNQGREGDEEARSK